MTNQITKNFKFPQDIKNITKEDCAKILRISMNESKLIKSQSDLAKATGINSKTLGHYFTAYHKPTQKNWDLLRLTLFGEENQIKKEKKMKNKTLLDAVNAAERLKALIFLLKDELNYFKESSSEAREILKEHIPGSEVGSVAGLLTALYDEDQLDALKVFSKIE